MDTFKKAVAAIRAAGRAVASAPYWGMALLASADNAGLVDIHPTKKTTRFTFVNPRRPNAGFTMTLAELFPEILAGTIDGIIKQGVHFAHAARVAGVAGAKNASTPQAWRDICERYDVRFEDVRIVAGPLAVWYRDTEAVHTPTAFRAVIDAALADDVTEEEPDDTEPDTDTDDETSDHLFVAMVETAGYPKRRDRLEAWLIEALEADAVKTGGTGLVSRTCLLGASIIQRQKDEADAAVVAAGADAQTLAPTGTNG